MKKIIVAILASILLISCERNETPVIHSSLIDAQGREYKTVKIGKQEWTVENWACVLFNNGDTIPFLSNLSADSLAWKNRTTPAMTYYYSARNAVAADSTYGALYNWYAVSSSDFAPLGWRVPTDADWDILKDYLVKIGYNYDDSKTENKIAKSMAMDGINPKAKWFASKNTGAIGNRESFPQQINASKFSALPGGCRTELGVYSDSTKVANWWSSTPVTSTLVYSRYLNYYSISINREILSKNRGLSVRLVRDL